MDALVDRDRLAPLCWLQEDIDEGFVYTAVTLEGWSPSPGSVIFTTQDSEAIALPTTMGISLERVLLGISETEGLDSTYSDEGDSATFQVIITNTGNTMLSSVVLTDTIVDAEAFDCDQDVTAIDSEFLPNSHPSGAPLVCIVTVPLTATYVDAGGFMGTSEVGLPVIRKCQLGLDTPTTTRRDSFTEVSLLSPNLHVFACLLLRGSLNSVVASLEPADDIFARCVNRNPSFSTPWFPVANSIPSQSL